jgi:hypothetical protein
MANKKIFHDIRFYPLAVIIFLLNRPSILTNPPHLRIRLMEIITKGKRRHQCVRCKEYNCSGEKMA